MALGPAPCQRRRPRARPRLPGGYPGREPVPLRHLAPAAGGRVARGRARRRLLRRPGGPAPVPRGGGPVRGRLARRARRGRRRDRDHGRAAGPRPGGAGAARTGDVVAVEDPGYPEARELFALHGARVVPVPVDAEGLVVSEIPANARLVYTTPSHQFPLGMPLSLARRRALLAHAARYDAAVVEDDYDSEFRRARRPLESLQALDRDGRVVYVGTFSKSLLPGLRVGYLVAPPSLRDALLAARQLTDGHGAVHVQGALARFIDDGLLARHVRKASAVYAERTEILLDALSG
ncbi:PLP-dependent aminotransferase family protein, partial [Promicromonospora sukumoe]|uniref:aminotransferase-like domain-containing protein n=1 Tax=Promicromonospora sukumoe TaxID=88382 RepID=UPI003656DDDB